MRISSLYECFERHLLNLTIIEETDRDFVIAVVESYLVNMTALGFNISSHAVDTFNELCFEVDDMLKKKIYGHISVQSYRENLRDKSAA